MKKSTKAFLLSALVFPGAGHLSLKKFVPGFALLAVTFTSLYYVVTTAVDHAMKVIEQIDVETALLDPDAITELAMQQPLGADAGMINMATMAIIIAWLIGVVDSYRLGRKADRLAEPEKDA